MPLASNISSDQGDSLRGRSEGRENPSHLFKLAELNLAPPGPEIALPFLSRATRSRYDMDVTWAMRFHPALGRAASRGQGKH